MVVRASSIPALVKDPRSLLKAGITGTDILWESGVIRQKTEEVPLARLVPDCKKPFLYVGITKIFSDRVRQDFLREPKLSDLSGVRLATKYPRIANEVLVGREINGVKVFYIPGSDEAMQNVFSDCVSVLGIEDTGTTRLANGIEILEKVLAVETRMIRADEKLTRMDRDILDDFREKIALTLERNR